MGKHLSFSRRKLLLIAIDAMLVNLAVILALSLRFDIRVPAEYWQAMTILAPIITAVTLGFLVGLKLYDRIWAYASIREMIAILKATTCSLAVSILVIYAFSLPHLPRSVYILSWVFINAFIGASRISWRLVRNIYLIKAPPYQKRVLIAGAGDAGAMLVRELQNNVDLHLQAVGFIDDDPHKQYHILSGVPVLGSRKMIPKLVKEFDIDEVIIAMPSVEGQVIRELVEICHQTRARVRILPGIYQSTNRNLLSRLQEVRMEDLLCRQPVQIDLAGIAGYIQGKTVLVTGAGGSIGSELCRQVLKFAPAQLVMVDNSEPHLFEIEMELRGGDHENIRPELMDVKNRERLEEVFCNCRPQVIFHAAAYKHVPMMERHPREAFTNNIIGTRNVALAADRCRAETFILVSTDKAVNPSSVMGASKRVAELIIKDLNRTSQTRFAAVRFGNVLGSRGSVVPIFMKQIEKGGPVTVTHPDMKRYFMTIPEAVQLIIQAGAMAAGGEIFVLDMGEMVRIDDLARDLIRLAGLEPDREIRIVYTGIRPGEKLYEELFTDRENMKATRHQRIFISRQDLDNDYIDISRRVASVFEQGTNGDDEARALLSQFLRKHEGEKVAAG